jgi:hypothetical protein
VQILLRAPDRWRMTAWSPRPALTRLVREFDSLVRCHDAGPLARAPAFEAGKIGAIPIPAANHVPFGYWLGRHPLKVEKAGSKPPWDTNSRAYPKRQRNNVESVDSARSNRAARTMLA